MITKDNSNIDELLNSYIDGELPVRKRTELQRLLSNDPKVAQRLRHLQQCKILVNSLPAEKAPAAMLENIKARLRGREDVAEKIHVIEQPVKNRIVLLTRVFAVAAMFVIAAVLSVVIYSVAPENAPINTGQQPNLIAAQPADSGGFESGRLDLKTGEFAAVDSFITRVVKDNGLYNSSTIAGDANRRVFTLNCDKQQLNNVLEELGSIWQKFDTANLYVNTKDFGRQVLVNDVTVQQVADIAASDNAVVLAGDFAVFNNMDNQFPLKQTVKQIQGTDELNLIPNRPVLTSDNQPLPEAPAGLPGEKTINITIILGR